MNKTPFMKFIASTVVFTFLVTNLNVQPSAFAAAVMPEVPLPYQVKLNASLSFSIPSDIGKLESFTRGTGPTLIHIQTAHGHYEAQQQIRKILHHLGKNYGINTLLVEGSAFELDPKLINFFPKDRKLTLKAADALTRNALLKGPELYLLDKLGERETDNASVQRSPFGISRAGRTAAYGIEELKSYRDNGLAFVNVLEAKQKTQNFLADMNIQIERLSSHYLNKDLRDFLRRVEVFEKNQIPFDAWLTYLRDASAQHLKMDFGDTGYQIDWPMMVRIFKIHELASKLDPQRFPKEREEFLKALQRFLPGNGKRVTGNDSFSVSHSTFTAVESLLRSDSISVQLPDPETSLLFEDMVRQLPRDFNYEAFPNVRYFIGTLLLQSELKAALLIEETTKLADKISSTLAKTEEEKALVGLLKDYQLLQKLFALELTPSDYDIISARKGELKPSELIKQLSGTEYGVRNTVKNPRGTPYAFRRTKLVQFEHISELDQLFDSAMRFYAGVKERDLKMEARIEERLKQTGAQKAVVITGGFHSQPFREHFTGKDYSYVLITPKLSGADDKGHQYYVQNALRFTLKSTRESEFVSDPGLRKGSYAVDPAAMRAEIRDIIQRTVGSGTPAALRQDPTAIKPAVVIKQDAAIQELEELLTAIRLDPARADSDNLIFAINRLATLGNYEGNEIHGYDANLQSSYESVERVHPHPIALEVMREIGRLNPSAFSREAWSVLHEKRSVAQYVSYLQEGTTYQADPVSQQNAEEELDRIRLQAEALFKEYRVVPSEKSIVRILIETIAGAVAVTGLLAVTGLVVNATALTVIGAGLILFGSIIYYGFNRFGKDFFSRSNDKTGPGGRVFSSILPLFPFLATANSEEPSLARTMLGFLIISAFFVAVELFSLRSSNLSGEKVPISPEALERQMNEISQEMGDVNGQIRKIKDPDTDPQYTPLQARYKALDARRLEVLQALRAIGRAEVRGQQTAERLLHTEMKAGELADKLLPFVTDDPLDIAHAQAYVDRMPRAKKVTIHRLILELEGQQLAAEVGEEIEQAGNLGGAIAGLRRFLELSVRSIPQRLPPADSSKGGRAELRGLELRKRLADKVAAGASWKAIDTGILKVQRAFGTNGIRGTGFNVDELQRMTAATAAELIDEWNVANAGKPLPVIGVAVDPRPQGEEGFSPEPAKQMAYARAMAVVLAAVGFKVRFYNKPVGSGHMIATTSEDYPAEQRNFAVLMGTASHNEVVDPKTGTLQFGLKVFKGNAPIMDNLAGRISSSINGDEKAGISQITEVPVLDYDQAVSEGLIEIVEDPASFEVERLDRIFNLGELGLLLREKFPKFRYAFNTMNGGMSKVDPLIVQRMGFSDAQAQVFNIEFMNEPSMREKVMSFVKNALGQSVRFAPDPTRKWFRGAAYDGYVAQDPENTIGLLIDGDADRLVLEQMGEISPNQIGPLVKYYLQKYVGDKNPRYKDARTVPTSSAMDLLDRALGLSEPEVTDVGSKNFVPFLGDLQVGLEESGHIAVRYKGQVFFDHPVALQLVMLRMVADTGKTWRELEDEMWQFITAKTGAPRIITSRTGIGKDEGAENYYTLLAKLPKNEALRREFGAALAGEFKAAGLDVTLKGFDTRAPGGVQFHFSDYLRVMPRKSGTDGSVRFYFESPSNAVPLLEKQGTAIMKKVLDQFLARSEARGASDAEKQFASQHEIPDARKVSGWVDRLKGSPEALSEDAALEILTTIWDIRDDLFVVEGEYQVEMSLLLDLYLETGDIEDFEILLRNLQEVRPEASELTHTHRIRSDAYTKRIQELLRHLYSGGVLPLHPDEMANTLGRRRSEVRGKGEVEAAVRAIVTAAAQNRWADVLKFSEEIENRRISEDAVTKLVKALNLAVKASRGRKWDAVQSLTFTVQNKVTSRHTDSLIESMTLTQAAGNPDSADLADDIGAAIQYIGRPAVPALMNALQAAVAKKNLANVYMIAETLAEMVEPPEGEALAKVLEVLLKLRITERNQPAIEAVDRAMRAARYGARATRRILDPLTHPSIMRAATDYFRAYEILDSFEHVGFKTQPMIDAAARLGDARFAFAAMIFRYMGLLGFGKIAGRGNDIDFEKLINSFIAPLLDLNTPLWEKVWPERPLTHNPGPSERQELAKAVADQARVVRAEVRQRKTAGEATAEATVLTAAKLIAAVRKVLPGYTVKDNSNELQISAAVLIPFWAVKGEKGTKVADSRKAESIWGQLSAVEEAMRAQYPGIDEGAINQDEVGDNSYVTLTFPIRRAEVRGIEIKDIKKVLVVDLFADVPNAHTDASYQRQIEFLKRQGKLHPDMEVKVVSYGQGHRAEKALKLVQEFSPDVILVDFSDVAKTEVNPTSDFIRKVNGKGDRELNKAIPIVVRHFSFDGEEIQINLPKLNQFLREGLIKDYLEVPVYGPVKPIGQFFLEELQSALFSLPEFQYQIPQMTGAKGQTVFSVRMKFKTPEDLKSFLKKGSQTFLYWGQDHRTWADFIPAKTSELDPMTLEATVSLPTPASKHSWETFGATFVTVAAKAITPQDLLKKEYPYPLSARLYHWLGYNASFSPVERLGKLKLYDESANEGHAAQVLSELKASAPEAYSKIGFYFGKNPRLQGFYIHPEVTAKDIATWVRNGGLENPGNPFLGLTTIVTNGETLDLRPAFDAPLWKAPENSEYWAWVITPQVLGNAMDELDAMSGERFFEIVKTLSQLEVWQESDIQKTVPETDAAQPDKGRRWIMGNQINLVLAKISLPVLHAQGNRSVQEAVEMLTPLLRTIFFARAEARTGMDQGKQPHKVSGGVIARTALLLMTVAWAMAISGPVGCVSLESSADEPSISDQDIVTRGPDWNEEKFQALIALVNKRNSRPGYTHLFVHGNPRMGSDGLEDEVRIAVETLGEYGDPRAIPVLKVATGDLNIPVRRAAKKALRSIEMKQRSKATGIKRSENRLTPGFEGSGDGLRELRFWKMTVLLVSTAAVLGFAAGCEGGGSDSSDNSMPVRIQEENDLIGLGEATPYFTTPYPGVYVYDYERGDYSYWLDQINSGEITKDWLAMFFEMAGQVRLAAYQHHVSIPTTGDLSFWTEYALHNGGVDAVVDEWLRRGLGRAEVRTLPIDLENFKRGDQASLAEAMTPYTAQLTYAIKDLAQNSGLDAALQVAQESGFFTKFVPRGQKKNSLKLLDQNRTLEALGYSLGLQVYSLMRSAPTIKLAQTIALAVFDWTLEIKNRMRVSDQGVFDLKSRLLPRLLQGELSDAEIDALPIEIKTLLLEDLQYGEDIVLGSYDLQEKLLVVSGPPGSGKDLGRMAVASDEGLGGDGLPWISYVDLFGKLDLYHSRNPRDGEVNGKNYQFANLHLGDSEKNRILVLARKHHADGTPFVIDAFVNKQLQGMALRRFEEEIALRDDVPSDKQLESDAFIRRDIVDGVPVKIVKRVIVGLEDAFKANRLTYLEGGYHWFKQITALKPNVFTVFMSPFDDKQLALRENNQKILDREYGKDSFAKAIAWNMANLMRKEQKSEVLDLGSAPTLQTLKTRVAQWMKDPVRENDPREAMARLGRKPGDSEEAIRHNAELIESPVFIEALNHLLGPDYIKHEFLITQQEAAKAKALAYYLQKRLAETGRSDSSPFLQVPTRHQELTNNAGVDHETVKRIDMLNRVLEGVVQTLLQEEYFEGSRKGKGLRIVNEYVYSGDEREIEAIKVMHAQQIMDAYFAYVLKAVNRTNSERLSAKVTHPGTVRAELRMNGQRDLTDTPRILKALAALALVSFWASVAQAQQVVDVTFKNIDPEVGVGYELINTNPVPILVKNLAIKWFVQPGSTNILASQQVASNMLMPSNSAPVAQYVFQPAVTVSNQIQITVGAVSEQSLLDPTNNMIASSSSSNDWGYGAAAGQSVPSGLWTPGGHEITYPAPTNGEAWAEFAPNLSTGGLTVSEVVVGVTIPTGMVVRVVGMANTGIIGTPVLVGTGQPQFVHFAISPYPTSPKGGEQYFSTVYFIRNPDGQGGDPSDGDLPGAIMINGIWRVLRAEVRTEAEERALSVDVLEKLSPDVIAKLKDNGFQTLGDILAGVGDGFRKRKKNFAFLDWVTEVELLVAVRGKAPVSYAKTQEIRSRAAAAQKKDGRSEVRELPVEVAQADETQLAEVLAVHNEAWAMNRHLQLDADIMQKLIRKGVVYLLKDKEGDRTIRGVLLTYPLTTRGDLSAIESLPLWQSMITANVSEGPYDTIFFWAIGVPKSKALPDINLGQTFAQEAVQYFQKEFAHIRTFSPISAPDFAKFKEELAAKGLSPETIEADAVYLYLVSTPDAGPWGYEEYVKTHGPTPPEQFFSGAHLRFRDPVENFHVGKNHAEIVMIMPFREGYTRPDSPFTISYGYEKSEDKHPANYAGFYKAVAHIPQGAGAGVSEKQPGEVKPGAERSELRGSDDLLTPSTLASVMLVTAGFGYAAFSGILAELTGAVFMPIIFLAMPMIYGVRSVLRWVGSAMVSLLPQRDHRTTDFIDEVRPTEFSKWRAADKAYDQRQEQYKLIVSVAAAIGLATYAMTHWVAAGAFSAVIVLWSLLIAGLSPLLLWILDYGPLAFFWGWVYESMNMRPEMPLQGAVALPIPSKDPKDLYIDAAEEIIGALNENAPGTNREALNVRLDEILQMLHFMDLDSNARWLESLRPPRAEIREETAEIPAGIEKLVGREIVPKLVAQMNGLEREKTGRALDAETAQNIAAAVRLEVLAMYRLMAAAIGERSKVIPAGAALLPRLFALYYGVAPQGEESVLAGIYAAFLTKNQFLAGQLNQSLVKLGRKPLKGLAAARNIFAENFQPELTALRDIAEKLPKSFRGVNPKQEPSGASAALYMLLVDLLHHLIARNIPSPPTSRYILDVAQKEAGLLAKQIPESVPGAAHPAVNRNPIGGFGAPIGNYRPSGGHRRSEVRALDQNKIDQVASKLVGYLEEEGRLITRTRPGSTDRSDLVRMIVAPVAEMAEFINQKPKIKGLTLTEADLKANMSKLVDALNTLKNKNHPEWFDYAWSSGGRSEARQKIADSQVQINSGEPFAWISVNDPKTAREAIAETVRNYVKRKGKDFSAVQLRWIGRNGHDGGFYALPSKAAEAQKLHGEHFGFPEEINPTLVDHWVSHLKSGEQVLVYGNGNAVVVHRNPKSESVGSAVSIEGANPDQDIIEFVRAHVQLQAGFEAVVVLKNHTIDAAGDDFGELEGALNALKVSKMKEVSGIEMRQRPFIPGRAEIREGAGAQAETAVVAKPMTLSDSQVTFAATQAAQSLTYELRELLKQFYFGIIPFRVHQKIMVLGRQVVLAVANKLRIPAYAEGVKMPQISERTATLASEPKAFKNFPKFETAKGILLGAGTSKVMDALLLTPKFAFNRGALALVRTVFGDMPVAVLVRDAKDQHTVDQLNIQLAAANRPQIQAVRSVDQAIRILGKESAHLKALADEDERGNALIAELLSRLPDTMIVNRAQFQSFLSFAGAEIERLVQDIRTQFAVARAA